MLGAIGLFAAMAALVVGGFAAYHFYLISCGMTTNEQFKWSDFYAEREAQRLMAQTQQQQEQDLDQNNKDAEISGLKRRHKANKTSTVKTEAPVEIKPVINIYNHGFLQNLQRVFSPPSL